MRRPGRPRLDEDDPSVPLTVSMPSKQLAAAEAQAKRDRVSVQDFIRRAVKKAAAAHDDDDDDE